MRKAWPWQVSFGLLSAIWGCSFWWIRVGLDTFTPLQVAFGRCAVGALVLIGVVLARKAAMPGRSAWKHLAVLALLLNSAPFALFAYGETHVSSILAGIINATTPLWTLLVTMIAFREEHPTRDRVVGLSVAFAGVLVLLGIWEQRPQGELIGAAACVAATLCYGIAFPYARRHVAPLALPPVSLAAVQVSFGAVLLTPFIALEAASGTGLRGPVQVNALIALTALGALGSGIAYVLNYAVIAATSSTTAASVTYVTPIVAVIVGLLALGEPVHWFEPVGAAIVLFGIATGQGRIRARK